MNRNERRAGLRRLAWMGFGFALRLHSSGFRSRFGPSMEETFEEILDRTDRLSAIGAMFQLLAQVMGMMAAAIAERVGSSALTTGIGVAALLDDLRVAVRSLLRRPRFSLTAAGTLALGIGASSAVFSVVDGVLLSPLPYPTPDRLVMVWSHDRDDPAGRGWLSLPDLDDLRETGAFEAVEGWNPGSTTIVAGEQPERAAVARLTGGLVSVFGMRPAAGRDIRRDDTRTGAGPVVMVSHAFWQSRLGGRPDVIGSTLSLSEVSHEIIGIAPEGFDFPSGTGLWVPLRHDLDGCGRGCAIYQSIARLPPSVDPSVASGPLGALGEELESTFPTSNTNKRFRVESLFDYQVGGVRSGLWILFAAVGLLLLVVCANLANLLLVRGSLRTREVSLRAALGASRSRLFWQISAENLVLAGAGGTAGVLMSFGLVDLFRSLAPVDVPRLEQAGPDVSVIAIMLGVALVATFVSGLGASAGLVRRGVWAGLGSGERIGPSARTARTRGALIALETSLSLALLFSAGLLLRSLGELYRVDLGFHERDVVRFSLSLPGGRYEDLASIAGFYATLEERLASLPGVESVGSIQGAPLAGGNVGGPVRIEGRPPADPGREPYAAVRPVTAGYMATLGLTILSGRGLRAGDGASEEAVVVVNERFVAENFPDGDALGARFNVTASYGFGSPTWTIVGVVRDVRRSLSGEPIAELYVPHGLFGPGFMQVHLRGGPDIASVMPRVLETVHSLDPTLPVTGTETIREAIRRDAASLRFYLTLLGAFAGLAAILATVGIYGVVAYVVSGRRREIAVRIALGARRSEIHAMFLRWGGGHALAGVVLGVFTSVGASRYLEAILFNVGALDPVVLAAASAVVLGTSVLAVLVPARAATSIDPGVALRPD